MARAKRSRKKPVKGPEELVRTYRGRRRVVLMLLYAAFVAVAWGAIDQQIMEGDFLRREGQLRHLRVVEMPAYRGMILDRYGEPLAISTPVDSVWADPRKLARNDAALKPLAKALELRPEALQRLLSKRKDRGFAYLKRRVNPDIAQRVSELHLDGVGLEREYRRYYPSGEVSAQLVGFTDVDDRGQEGLELSYEDWLRATPGRKRVLKDGRARVVKDVESVRAPEPGKDLVLSIDRRIQFLAYRELKAAVQEHQARAGTAVVLDVETGEVLAMVNQPSYNPNGRRDGRGGRLRNRAITDVLEPGSTIKPFTVAAALELGKIRPDGLVDTAPGYLRVGRNLVRDHHDLGRIDVSTVLSRSSNVGASRIALQMTPEEMWRLFSRLGFGAATGSTFPGETAGQLPEFSDWSRFEQATISFGYGLSVSVLQLARAYAVLAADGVARPASLLKVDAAEPGARVMSAQTARTVRTMLERVASADGTAPLAAIPGYRVAGKTGTARKSVAGGYAKDKYQALFAGMAPASSPRLVMVVMIDEPRAGKYYGGQVAAPVFAKVMAGALRLLNVAPDTEGPHDLRLASVGAAP